MGTRPAETVMTGSPARRVLSADKVVTPDGVLEPGWVEVRDGLIAHVARGRPEDAGPGGMVICS
jgi:N-acetylglucosamine-6-phosphate deacetylase